MSTSDKPRSGFTPFVPEETDLPEMTFRAVALGVAMAIVLGAANAYLGMKAGLTVAATFPAAVVDSESRHDGQLGLDVGLERAGVTVRCMTEELADDDDAAADLAALTATVEDALTGRTGPELELDGYEILDVARATSRSLHEGSGENRAQRHPY